MFLVSFFSVGKALFYDHDSRMKPEKNLTTHGNFSLTTENSATESTTIGSFDSKWFEDLERLKYCGNYREKYTFPFLTDVDNINDESGDLLINLFKYSPLFYQYGSNGCLPRISNSNLKRILQSKNKEFNVWNGNFGNFHHYLNNFLETYFNDTESPVLTINPNKEEHAQILITKGYFLLVNEFFNQKKSSEDIDKIMFEILIPFKNKINCILFDKTKKNYCKKCLNMDKIECCSHIFYTEEEKKEGDAYFKRAAVALFKRLEFYIGYTKNTKKHIPVNCHYDFYTKEICGKFFSEFQEANPIKETNN